MTDAADPTQPVPPDLPDNLFADGPGLVAPLEGISLSTPAGAVAPTPAMTPAAAAAPTAAADYGDDDELDDGPTRSARRAVAAVAAAIVVIAAVAGGVAVVRDRRQPTGTTAAPLATGQVTQGNLTVSDRLDGTLQRTSELTVVHRISGVTTGTSSGAGSGATATLNVARTGGSAATANAVLIASTGTIPTSDITGAGSGGTTPGVTDPGGSSPTDPAVTDPTPVRVTDSGGSGLSSTPPATDATPLTTNPGFSAPIGNFGPDGGATTVVTTPAGAAQTACPDPSTTTSTTTAPTDPSTTTSSTSTTTDPTDPSTTTTTTPTTCTTQPDGATTTTAPGAQPGGSTPVGGGFPTGAGGGARTAGGIGAGGGSGATGAGAGAGAASTPRELVSSIIPVGSAVRSGDVLYSVAGRPVVALTGAVPAWRDLDTSASAGADVQQLEAALAALGYDDGGKMTVDDTYDSHTSAAVTTWQEGLGLTGTGKVPLGWVVFIPEATTVTSVAAAVGQSLADGNTVLKLATPSQQVVVEIPEKLRTVVAPGLTVQVSGVTGKVSRLASGTGTNNAVTVLGYVALDKPIAAADGSAVTARFTVTDATNVLLVPVAAVASRIDGSYAVLAVDDTGTDGTWIPVEVHGVANAQVAVTGPGLRPSLTIAVPG